MKIQNTRRIAEKLMELMQLKEASSMVNTIITHSIAANSIIPPDPEALRKEAELIQKEMPDYSVDRIMMLLMVESMIGPYLEQQPEVMDFFMNWIAAESRVFDVSEFNENPYIKNIDFANQTNGDYELRYHDNMPYELDIYNVPKRIEELCVDIPRVSCFPEDFKYPVIFQKSINSTWMSVSPNEVFTMEKAIKNAKGNVLTLGCGMGYFAYMSAVGDAVKGVADKIKSFLHFSVPDEGPLTDYESWMPDFMDGLAKGINKSKSVVAKAVEGVSQDMVINPNVSATTTAMESSSDTSAQNTASIVGAIREAFAGINTQGGDTVIPVYIGGTMLDEIVVNAQQRINLRSGGR